MSLSELCVKGIAVRTARRGAMKEMEEAEVRADFGLVDDVPGKSVERGVTFLLREQWDEVNKELGDDLPWHTRRANVLLEGAESLLPLVGKRIRVGDNVEVTILDETRPCGLMEYLRPGLEEVLRRDGRGGVLGRVMTGGMVRVGDAVVISDEV